ncbi:MAG TPA: hypothetical protein VK281_02545 [Xanthobacteraceae bacterium]|nr:hypothetical protein [Xanthobacteraceae bacterium]
MNEVWRIVRAFDLAEGDETPYGFALIAERAGHMLGTLGVICYWYGDVRFFTDRWFFAVPDPQREIGSALRAEAEALAREAGLKLVINLKQRGVGNVIYARCGST